MLFNSARPQVIFLLAYESRIQAEARHYENQCFGGNRAKTVVTRCCPHCSQSLP